MSQTSTMGAGGYRRTRPKTPWKPLLGRKTDAEVGAYQRAATTTLAATGVTSTPQVRASMMLLSAAKRNPMARRKVKRIVRRANQGDPQAMTAVKNLRTAKSVQDKQKRKVVADARKRRAATALPTVMEPSAVSRSALTKRKKLSFWEKGSG